MNTILIILVLAIIIILFWALWGSRDTSAPTEKISAESVQEAEDLEEEKERAFRRRSSDREIEENISAEKGPSRRKSDSVSDLNRMMTDRFELPHSIDEIISDSSRFRIYKRTLKNAEVYASKGDFGTAVSLFEGVRNRINDEETLGMIDEDISYIEKFSEKKSAADQEKKQAGNLLKGIDASGGLRFTIDGPIPDSINIGVIDPNRNMDPDKIADMVSGGLRREIESLRESITGIKGSSAGEAAFERMSLEIGELRSRMAEMSLARERTLLEMERLRGGGGMERLDELKKNIENLSTISESAKKIAEINDKLKEMSGIEDSVREIKKIHDDISSMDREPVEKSEISDMKDDISRLNRKLGEMADREQALQQRPPAPVVFETASAAPIPITFDPKPFIDMMNAIPKNAASIFSQPAGIPAPVQTAPAGLSPQPVVQSSAPPAPLAPGNNPPTEKMIEKEKISEAEEEDGFELMSDYGRDKDDDNTLTDEDIFEKILKDDPKGRDENAFEVLGDKEDDRDGEINLRDPEYQRNQRDNEPFYRNLLNTDRRKKKELPILKVSYDFTKLPDEFSLSREKNILEYSFYKYKPMLEKAGDFIRNRKVRDAINYYNVILGQNIPPEFKSMVKKNIRDLTEYLEKYLASD